MERKEILAVLSTVKGLRYEAISHLDLATFPYGSEDAWVAAGITPILAKQISGAFKSPRGVEYGKGTRIIAIGEPDYPESLYTLHSPPLVLYVEGQLKPQPAVAVVGTRRATPYGRQAVDTFIPLLVAADHTVVSGLAEGIDTFAHLATLRCGGHTVAVMGCGLDRIYPSKNKLLAQKIVEMGGALISEYPQGTPPLKAHFPARNRIISGLSKACVVIEGDIRSGALITAEHALEQGKEVLALPGSIFSPQSRGPNYLITQGATPLTCPEDLYDALNIHNEVATAHDLDLTEDARTLVRLLRKSSLSVDEIAIHTGQPVSLVTATLSELEISGIVERSLSGQYILLKGLIGSLNG